VNHKSRKTTLTEHDYQLKILEVCTTTTAKLNASIVYRVNFIIYIRYLQAWNFEEF